MIIEWQKELVKMLSFCLCKQLFHLTLAVRAAHLALNVAECLDLV